MDKHVFEAVAEALSSVLGVKIEADHAMSVEKSHIKRKWLLVVMPSDTRVLTDVKAFCEKLTPWWSASSTTERNVKRGLVSCSTMASAARRQAVLITR